MRYNALSILVAALSLALAWSPFGLILASIITHECGHGTFLRSRRANAVLGTLFGALSLLPFRERRREHAMHHAMSGSLEEPTVERGRRAFAAFTERHPILFGLAWRWWVPILAANEYAALWRRGRLVEWALLLAIWVPAIVWYPWLLLTAYGYLMLVELVNLPHHLMEPVWSTGGQPVDRHMQLRATKSCASVPVWSRWLILNFNFHREHHLRPWIRWQDLPAQHDGTPRVSEFAWSVAARRLPWRVVFGKYLEADR